MEIHIKTAGVILVLLSFLHVFFPARFNWKKDLEPLSLINRQMMYVHTFFIGLLLLLMGTLCLASAELLMTTTLGKQVSFGFFLFWLVRLIFQFFIYSPGLWRSKKFETTMHIVFSGLWFYLTAVFFLAYY